MRTILTIDIPINQSSSPKFRSNRWRTHTRATTKIVASEVIDHITAMIVGPFPSVSVAFSVEAAIEGSKLFTAEKEHSKPPKTHAYGDLFSSKGCSGRIALTHQGSQFVYSPGGESFNYMGSGPGIQSAMTATTILRGVRPRFDVAMAPYHI